MRQCTVDDAHYFSVLQNPFRLATCPAASLSRAFLNTRHELYDQLQPTPQCFTHCVFRRRITLDTKDNSFTECPPSALPAVFSFSLFLPPLSFLLFSFLRLHLIIVKTTTHEDSGPAWLGLCFASLLVLALSHFPHFPLSIIPYSIFICLLQKGPSTSGRSGVATARKMGSIWVSLAHAAGAGRARPLTPSTWALSGSSGSSARLVVSVVSFRLFSCSVFPFFLPASLDCDWSAYEAYELSSLTQPASACPGSTSPDRARPFPSFLTLVPVLATGLAQLSLTTCPAAAAPRLPCACLCPRRFIPCRHRLYCRHLLPIVFLFSPFFLLLPRGPHVPTTYLHLSTCSFRLLMC